MEFNNIYEFLSWLVIYSSTSFSGFITLLMLCTTTIFIFATVSNFRLFEIRNTKLNEDISQDNIKPVESTNNVQNSDNGYIVYDMLMKAYNKYKKD